MIDERSSSTERSGSQSVPPTAKPEEELKFRVSGAFVVPYLGGRGLRHVVVGPRTLDATYWDTPDLRLARRGHTLRYRTSDDGSEDKWTLKLGGRSGSALMQRSEVDFDGAPDFPPKVLVDALLGITADRQLVTVARLRSDQDQYRVDDADGNRLLIVEDDRVQVIDRGRIVGSLREVEVELADSARGRRALERTTRILRVAGSGEPDPTSKLEHVLGPVAHPSHTALRRNATIEELVRATLRDPLDQLLQHDPGVRLDLGPEEVHRARVATRRLRANLRTLRPLLDRRSIDELRNEIAWAGQQLGRVRDLDVLRSSFSGALEAEPDLDGEALLAIVDAERAANHRCLVDAMGTARWHAMLDRLEASALLPPLAQTVSPTDDARRAIRPLLRKSWRRLARRVDSARENKTTWHEVRKAAKSTRYAAELFAPFIEAAPRLARKTEDIQTQLGEQQDKVVAREWLQGHNQDEHIGHVARRLADHYDDSPDDKPPGWSRTWNGARRAAGKLA